MNESGRFDPTPEHIEHTIIRRDLEFDAFPSDLEDRFVSLDEIQSVRSELGEIPLELEYEFLQLKAKQSDTEVAYVSEAQGQEMAKLILKHEAEVTAHGLEKIILYEIDPKEEELGAVDRESMFLATRAELNKNGLLTPLRLTSPLGEADQAGGEHTPAAPEDDSSHLHEAAQGLDESLGETPAELVDEFRLLEEIDFLEVEAAQATAYRSESMGQAMAKIILEQDKETTDQGLARPEGYEVNLKITDPTMTIDRPSFRLATLAALRSSGLDTDIVFPDQPLE